jgi:hypothetical protein
VHVRVDLADVADLHVLPGGRHHLHHANRADRASLGLIQARLLVDLSRHQYVIELVLIAVFLDETHRIFEPLRILAAGRRLYVLRVLQVLLEEHVRSAEPFG